MERSGCHDRMTLRVLESFGMYLTTFLLPSVLLSNTLVRCSDYILKAIVIWDSLGDSCCIAKRWFRVLARCSFSTRVEFMVRLKCSLCIMAWIPNERKNWFKLSLLNILTSSSFMVNKNSSMSASDLFSSYHLLQLWTLMLNSTQGWQMSILCY